MGVVATAPVTSSLDVIVLIRSFALLKLSRPAPGMFRVQGDEVVRVPAAGNADDNRVTMSFDATNGTDNFKLSHTMPALYVLGGPAMPSDNECAQFINTHRSDRAPLLDLPATVTLVGAVKVADVTPAQAQNPAQNPGQQAGVAPSNAPAGPAAQAPAPPPPPPPGAPANLPAVAAASAALAGEAPARRRERSRHRHRHSSSDFRDNSSVSDSDSEDSSYSRRRKVLPNISHK